MNFRLTEEQSLIVGTFRRFAETELRALGAASEDSDAAAAEITPKVLTKAGELGLLLDAVPEDAGGMLAGAFDHTLRALRGIELGRGCAGLAALLETNVEPALATARWGGAAVKSELFGALAAGGLATTIHDGSGRLTIKPAGDGYQIDGTFGPVPALGIAGHVLVLASTTTAEPVVLVVEAAALKVDPMTPSGWRAARWGKINAKAAIVAGSHVLARGADARAAHGDVLAWLRLSLAARAVGVADVAMRFSAAYGQERIQFGQPIGSFESLARMQDRHETSVMAARLLVLRAATALDAGEPDAHDLVSRARDFAANVVRDATIDAVQIYGGYGFVRDFPVEKLMRDARAFEVLTGEEALSRVLARRPALQARA